MSDVGLLTRHGDPSHRQKVEYRLTEPAIQLVPVMAQLGDWGARWLPTAAELADACRRRGLQGIEHTRSSEEGDGGDIATFRTALVAEGIELAGILHSGLDRSQMAAAAAESAATGAPIIVPAANFDWTLLPEMAEVFARAGTRLLLAHRSHPELVTELIRVLGEFEAAPVIGLAWEFRPSTDNPQMLAQVMKIGGDQIRYVRMYGGGPEAHAQSGMGIGSVMGRLTLARFDGPLVLVPSEPLFHYVWSAWLGRAGGWGCGSKQADESLVTLATAGGREE